MNEAEPEDSTPPDQVHASAGIYTAREAGTEPGIPSPLNGVRPEPGRPPEESGPSDEVDAEQDLSPEDSTALGRVPAERDTAPEDGTPPAKLHAEPDRPAGTIPEPRDGAATGDMASPDEQHTKQNRAGLRFLNFWVEPLQDTSPPQLVTILGRPEDTLAGRHEVHDISDHRQPPGPQREAVRFGASPPGYLHLTAVLERMVTHAAPDLLTILSPLSEENWLSAAVDEGLRIFHASPEPEESRDLIVAIYNNRLSVVERDRRDQLRELGRLWEEAEQELWRGLKDGELQFIILVGEQEIKVPLRSLRSNSLGCVLRKERIIWADQRAADTHSSGVPLVCEAEFERWMLSEGPRDGSGSTASGGASGGAAAPGADTTSPGTIGRPPQPYWGRNDLRKLIETDLEENGIPQRGDGRQAALERMIKAELAKTDIHPAESTIRDWVKGKIDDFRQRQEADK
jgi:hypothetical protein